jgi:hypothetical protein
MAEVRYRLSWQLAIAIMIVMVVSIVPVVVYFLDFKSIFLLIISAIIGWSVLILIALMGAFLLGLAVGHRAASKTDFSPFEVEMLKMNEEVKALKEMLHKHNLHHTEKGTQPTASPGSSTPKEPTKEAHGEEKL